MKKLREYLINRFLPAWCREELLEENRQLRERVDRQVAEIARLKAYIGGMTDALRRQPRIIVNGGDRQ